MPYVQRNKMDKIMPKVILDYYTKEDGVNYSDGSIEDKILNIYQGGNAKIKIDNMLADNPSWPEICHLSEERKNLLSWYDFKDTASLLEIGSGWGALTGLFCEKVDKVTAVELTKKRAEITAYRHKEKSNLTVIAGNIDRIQIKKKFDYVTSIGVLEYAGKYTNSENPYFDFLLKLKSFLKDDGRLIIAIENKFGLKYWSGVREDHAGGLFESLEDYPEDRGVRTFGKKGINDLLKRAGFRHIDFYYPLPDYKLPDELFSDQYLPSTNHNIRAAIMPFIDYSQKREYLFNEKLVSDNIVKEGQFGFFANSFLIFARKEGE
jgi:2-polyprenyl-3-methyl-5-hydroxy-6-metoxy-1,4-benzoquinol methylase